MRNAFRRGVRHSVEQLELRRLLSVTVAPQDTDADGVNELIITGNGGNDRVLVFDDDQATHTDVVIDANNNGAFDLGEVNFPFAQEFEEIEANLGGGNDTLRYFLVSDNNSERSLLVDVGSGNNTFLFSSPTTGVSPFGNAFDPSGADLALTSGPLGTGYPSFDIQVLAGNGTDNLAVDLSRTSMIGANVNISLDARGGADNITVNYPDFNQGEEGIAQGDIFLFDTLASSVQTFIDGGDGNNNYTINMATNVEDGSTLDVDVVGRSGKDNVQGNFDIGVFSNPIGSSHSRTGLTFNADLGSNNDTFSGNVDLGTLASFLGEDTQARFNVNGNDGNDSIRYQDVTTGGGDSAVIAGLLELSGRGNRGNDTVDCDLDTLGGARLTTGTTGEFRSILNGDSGSDKVAIDVVGGANADGTWDLEVLGGTDLDRISIACKMDGTVTFRGGGPVLDGGLGTDKWDTENGGSSVFFIRRSAEILDESLQPPQ